MTNNQVLENCQLEKSHWKINHIVTTEFWPKINIPSSSFTISMLNCLENTPVWQLCDSCQILDLINFQNNLTLPNSNTAGISLDSRLKYSKITHRYAKDSPIYAIKQINICAKYRVLDKPALAWVACPGILQILICITQVHIDAYCYI